MAIVILRYWAAAKEAAGAAEEKVSAQTLAGALEAARSARGLLPAPGSAPPTAGHDGGDRLGRILACSSFLINGDPAGTRPHESITLADGYVIEVLPPFAGG